MSSHCHDEHDHGHGGHSHEATPGSGKSIVKKTWDERMNEQPELESDADEQLLMHIPFTGQVKLHSILIRTSNSESAPKPSNTASELRPTQEFELSQTSEIQDIGVKRALFGKIQNLTLFVEDNHGEDVSRICYLGFKGDWMQLGKAPTNIIYEAAANPNDHKVKGTSLNQMGSNIGQ
ncbi:60s ribosomal protein l3 [Botrytis cinerea]